MHDTPDALALLSEIRDLLQRHDGPPLLLDAVAAAGFVGVSRSGFYRLAAEPGFPRPVGVSGTGPRWRRADLERWTEKLRPTGRRTRRLTEAGK